MREIFKVYNQELWYSFTMSIERNGKLRFIMTILIGLKQVIFSMHKKLYGSINT